ncbi:MAG: inositol monophosphatase [Alphaproteobacteria bacterium]|nr:inositol monophosphatase [Alphaproteobacteria bacterium]
MVDAALPRLAIQFPLLNMMARAAAKASRKLVRDFGEVEQLQVSKKGPGDFVSTADLRAEKTIKEELMKAKPGAGFLMEESGEVEAAPGLGRWIVDPLDGTTNFLHGVPHFAISMAYEERGQVIAGLIYDPLLDEMFYAVKGMGAFLNDRRLRVAVRDRLPDALMANSRPHAQSDASKTFSGELQKAAALAGQAAGMRRMGSATLDLCYVAAGRYDLYIGIDLCPWDMAAGVLIAKEAGAVATDLNGKDKFFETKTVMVANDRLHHAAMSYIKGI